MLPNITFIRSALLVASVAASLVFLAGSAPAASIILDPGTGVSSVGYDAGSVGGDDYKSPVPLPFEDSHGGIDPVSGADANVSYNLSDSAFTTTFDMFQCARTTGTTFYCTVQVVGTVYFTPSEDIEYSFSGSFDLVSGAVFRGSSINVTLRSGCCANIFSQVQNKNGPNESYTLGEPGQFSGSPTGTLLAGTEYRLQYVFASITYCCHNDADFADGIGSITLSFGTDPPEPVPVPSMGPLGLAMLWAFLGLAGYRGLRV